MGERQTFYQILGVPENAKPEEIRASYLAKARKLHPDNFRGAPKRDQARSEELMRELNQAWSTLSNKQKRSKYDLKIASQKSGNSNFSSSNRTSYQEWTPEPAPKKTTPRYATKEEMQLTWFAKLVKPLPLALILAAVVAVAVIASIGIDNNDGANRTIPVERPTDPVLGCMNRGTGSQGIRVQCVNGEFDATIYGIVSAGEECPNSLEAVYAGNGEIFCVFYEDKPS